MNDIEKMTRMSQLAMQSAAQMAEGNQNPSVEPWHLFLALLDQDEGIVPRVLEHGLKIDLKGLRKKIESQVDRLPRVTGDNIRVHASPDLVRLFQGAEKEASAMGDDFVSTEHFVLSALKGNCPAVAEALKNHAITEQKFSEALNTMRGNQRVTDDNPEAKFDALKKYARDLTHLAE
ncbi:MAG: type VI secretion system ATPase TssH, partial [Bdellovibrionales bacterium]|nr:type VI secretion system ATPase TssH [Bdellovibrionales bacterium]